ncbi:serine hydrolase domain-containing protein [Pedobacter cryophilus]|uniref:Beta-N-acetylglucosaminidase n=1 Tax=Pedobacter cryophilus TaxID=2571271 RepID=A0A4U1C6L5_9SPHI|nr:serine hydrolase [Pedobacter cryophilus]TKC01042.1 beta-N-acetylglucosaminidase [Pedobacter cryophilus]
MNHKILVLLILVISASFLACGQEHQQSKTWLSNFKEIEKTTVVLNNSEEILPLKDLEKKTIASIDLGFNHHIVFDSLLNKYDKVDHFNGSVYQANNQLKALIDDLKFYNTVILCLSDVSVFNEEVLGLIKELEGKKQVIIALFGDGRSLTKLDQFNAPIVYSPQHNNDAANFVAQLIFGGVSTEARLATSYTEKYQKGEGSDLVKIRLKYTVPEDAGINTDDLKKIDAIAAEAIKEKAAPGMVVFIAKGGKVIFNKAYGYHTYDKETKSKIDDIFDLASITKTSATTMEVMRLYEQGQLNLDTSISTYISKARKTNKQEIKVKEVMLHQAGFIPFIPFYNAMEPGDSSLDSTETYSVKVADSFYMKKDYYKDIMWKQMLESNVKTSGKYVYSDLSMYFMKEIVESISRQSLSSYVKTNFYDPLGMYTTGFNPRYRFSKSRIVPTENDEYFRNTLLWGYVHDQGAAMVGGVSGHAGLFSNASDLATLYQMLLNKGTYGGKRFFKPSTVELFTARQSNVSRRGLGFDRWDPEPNKDYPSKLASSQTYGHTGYTGTCVWVDPKDDLVYIFLSNRVNPKVTNQLSTLNIRPRIQDVIYEAIAKANQKLN